MMEDNNALTQEVFQKISTIQRLAGKTNLLAINASIETIHATELLHSFHQIVEDHLIVQARIIATLLQEDPGFIHQGSEDFARAFGIEEICITDGQGNIEFTSKASLIHRANKMNSQRASMELPKSEGYKEIRLERIDQPGTIQMGAHYVRPKGQEAINGFGVVAKEAKRLADLSKEIAARITELAQNDRLGEISSPLGELMGIARQTNLLGVRAAIEAAHSTNDKQDFDHLLNVQMLREARLAARFVEILDSREGKESMEVSEMMDSNGIVEGSRLGDFCEYVGIGEIWVTDENGKAEHTNVSGGKGFVYQNEGQTAPFLRLLTNTNLEVTAPPSSRALDNKVFKYVGVSRRGKPGIFQIGSPSRLYGESTAEGFSEVAKQIKSLAQQSDDVTQEIQDILGALSKTRY